jgi:hypothetical protein
MKIRIEWMIVLLFILIAGCATKKFVIENANFYYSDKKEKIDLLIEPFHSVGVLETWGMRHNEVVCVKGMFPNMLTAEYFPARIRWNAIAVDKKGKEHFAQAIFFKQLDFSGKYPFYVLIDGKKEDLVGGKVAVLATGVDFLYDLNEKETVNDFPRFMEDVPYRDKMIQESGSEIKAENIVPDFFEKVVAKWNEYEISTGGFLLSPIDETQIVGGYLLEVKFANSIPENKDVEKILSDLKLRSLGFQKTENSLFIQYAAMDDKANKNILAKINSAYPDAKLVQTEEVMGIAGINPQYSYSEKFVSMTRGALSFNYMGTGLGFLIELATAPGAPSNGLDSESVMPSRRAAGIATTFFLTDYQENIKRLNETNRRLIRENEFLKMKEGGE